MSVESDARAGYQAKIRAALTRLFWISAESQEELERLADAGVDRKVCTNLVRCMVPIGYLADRSVGVLHGPEARLILRLCWAYAEAVALFDDDAAASMWISIRLKDAPSNYADVVRSLASVDDVIGRIRRGREFILSTSLAQARCEPWQPRLMRAAARQALTA
jgi:hypothetical protein